MNSVYIGLTPGDELAGWTAAVISVLVGLLTMMHATVRLVHEAQPQHAFAVVKLAIDVSGAAVQPSPLRGDPALGDDENRRAELLQPGNDFFDKPRVDVAVSVGAFAPPGTEVPRMDVRCSVGDVHKRVTITGRRCVRWSPTLRFTDPEPFTTMPMTNRNAYGGTDGRVPFEEPRSTDELMTLLGAFPGTYPRNPAGKGYVVSLDPVDGDVELPNLEDPDRLLTPETLFVRDPREWWLRPLPCTLGFRDLAMFPRLLPFGWRPAFAPPDDDRLEEVRLGDLPAGFARRGCRRRTRALGDARIRERALVRRALRRHADRGHGDAHGGPRRALHRCRRRRRSVLRVEGAGDADRDASGRRWSCVPRRRRWTSRTALGRSIWPRVFLPRIHKYIPITLELAGREIAAYEALPDRPRRARRVGISHQELTPCRTNIVAVLAAARSWKSSRSTPRSTRSRPLHSSARSRKPSTRPWSVAPSSPGPTARGARRVQWLPCLQTLSVRRRDRVLVVQPSNWAEPIVTGVVDGFARRPEAERSGPALTLLHDERLRVADAGGNPLLDIIPTEEGPVVKLLGADVNLELRGKLRIRAEELELVGALGDRDRGGAGRRNREGRDGATELIRTIGSATRSSAKIRAPRRARAGCGVQPGRGPRRGSGARAPQHTLFIVAHGAQRGHSVGQAAEGSGARGRGGRRSRAASVL